MSFTQKMFSITLLTIAGLVATSLPARADADDARERCERRIHKAEQNLRQAIDRHGEGSRQARRRHEQLEEVRRRCGFRDHDRDRDRDRDHDHDHDHGQF